MSCVLLWICNSGFAGLAKYKGPELRGILKDAGLTCISSHFGIEELRKNQADRIAWATDVGLTQMLVPSLDAGAHPSMDDVKRAADEYNKIGEQAAKSGIQQGLHNEGFELSKVDGKRTYDILFELLDPKLIKFQFQVSTISEGYDAAEYFTKYPGRFISMHVQGWSAQAKKMYRSAKTVWTGTKSLKRQKWGALRITSLRWILKRCKRAYLIFETCRSELPQRITTSSGRSTLVFLQASDLRSRRLA